MSEEAERKKRHRQRRCAQSKTALAQPISYVESTFRRGAGREPGARCGAKGWPQARGTAGSAAVCGGNGAERRGGRRGGVQV